MIVPNLRQLAVGSGACSAAPQRRYCGTPGRTGAHLPHGWRPDLLQRAAEALS
jgi:hypothetical protein